MRAPFAGRKSRTLAGLALAAAVAPFMIALTACLPVPLGDPEKSRIDPEFSGVWLPRDDQGQVGLWLMEPYDARTWLVTLVSPKMPESSERTATAPSVEPDGLVLLEQQSAALSELESYQAWLTPIRNVRFLVLEPKIVVAADNGMAPQMWFAFAITWKGKDKLELRMVNSEFNSLNNVKTSAEAKAIIAHGLGNPKLLNDSAVVLTRVHRAQYGRVEEVLKKLKIRGD